MCAQDTGPYSFKITEQLLLTKKLLHIGKFGYDTKPPDDRQLLRYVKIYAIKETHSFISRLSFEATSPTPWHRLERIDSSGFALYKVLLCNQIFVL